MLVKCINNNKVEKFLTIGQDYLLEKEDHLFYFVNINNKKEPFLKNRFEIVGGQYEI